MARQGILTGTLRSVANSRPEEKELEKKTPPEHEMTGEEIFAVQKLHEAREANWQSR